MISRPLLFGPYQRKAELLAAEPDLQLTVIVPRAWREGGIDHRLERRHTAGYRLIEVPLRLNGHFHLHWYPTMPGVLTAEEPHLVHLDEEPYNLATFLAARAARAVGARAVFFTWQNLRRSYPPPFRQFESWLYRHVDGAIAGSQTAAQVLRAKGYAGQLAVVPQFGVDTGLYKPAEGPRPAGPFTVGYVGRLVWAKGVDLLLHALATFPVPWRLVIAGDGPARPGLLQQAAELGIAGQVHWCGWLAGPELAEFYRSLDVLVLPSRSTPSWTEQFGRVLIEAMASRVACVGAASGEIPQVLGDAGLTFPENDFHALQGCLSQLATDDIGRRRLAHAGYRRALSEFTMERVVANTAAFYRAILATGEAPG